MKIEKNDIQDIKVLLTKMLHVDFLPYKNSTVERRIEKRMKVLQISEAKTYIDYLNGHEDEIKLLGKDVFINVTDFFRDPHVFQKIKHRILPTLFTKNKQAVKVWVAGCATGEEAYSFAILIKEFCEENGYDHKIKIIATDIKEEVINKARRGLYTTKEVLGLNEQRLKRFFDREGDNYRIKKEIRTGVIFAVHDMISDPPFARVDLLSCRNLLIYLDKEHQKKALASLVFALNLEGFLLLGKSETAIDLSYDLKSIDSAYKIYKRIKNSRPNRRLNFDITYQDSLLPPLLPLNENKESMKEHELTKSFQHIIHQKYAPAVVIIDEQFHVKYITSSAKKYINTPEDFTKIYSLLNLAPEAVTAVVRTAIAEIKKGQKRSVSILPITYSNEAKTLSIMVELFEPEEDRALFYAILFEENHNIDKSTKDIAKRINLALHNQLADTEENLRKTIGELENTNQNLLASNEELQSTNEEYISVNEELQTINFEYQETINELSISNKDVGHLLQSTDIGTVFLDDKLHIRKFTNPIKKLINIDDIDLKRPLKNFTHNLKNINIYTEAKAVLDNNQLIEKEVVSEEDVHYLMRAMPYDVDEGNRKGIVLSFINIQQLKDAEKALAESELLYRSVFDYANDGIVLVNENEKKVSNVNQRQLDMLGYSREEYLKITFSDIFPKIQSNGEKIATKLRHYSNAGGVKSTGVVEWTLKRKDKTLIEAEISTVNMPKPYEGYTLNIIRNVTQRKKAQVEILTSRKRFETVFDNSSLGISIATFKFNIMRVNKTFARMIGYTPKQLSQMSFSDITHHEDRKLNKQYLDELISGKRKVINFEKRYVKKNGTVFWARLWVSILNDGSGEDFFLANMRDITKEKQAVEAIRDSELRYRFLFEKNIDAVLIYELKNNKIRSANKSACELFECSKKYLLEHTPMDFFPEFQENGEPTAQLFVKKMQILREKGEARHFMQLKTKKGKLLETEVTVFRLYDSPDSEMVVQFKDITTEKNAQELLKSSEKRFRSLFENSAIGIGIFDVEKMIVADCNQQFAQLHGFTIEEFKKTKPQDVTANIQADGRGVMPHLQEQIEAVQKNGSHTANNWLCKRKDGTIFHTEVTLNILDEATPNIIFVHMRDITEKYAAQEAIKEREERFRSLFEHSADAVSIVDSRTLTLVDCNKKAAKMYGVPKSELIGKPPVKFSVKTQADGRPTITHIKEQVEIVKKQGYYFIENWVSKRPNGSIFYAEVSLNSFPAPNDHLIIVQVRDITEKHQAQQKIQEQKDYLRTIIDLSPNFIFSKNLKSEYIFVNKALAKAYGTSVEDMQGKTDADFSPNESEVAFFQQKDREAIKGGKVIYIPEEVITTATGEVRILQTTKFPMQDMEGKMTQMLGVSIDITQLKAGEKRLQEQKNYLRTIIDLIPNLIFAKNKNREFTLVNKAVADIYGEIPQNILGKTDADFNPSKEEIDFYLEKDEEVMETKKTVHIPLETITKMNGEVRSLQTTKVPVFDNEGNLIEILGVATDITELKKVEQNLRESQVRFKAVFENSYSIIAVVDAAGNLIEQNKPLRENGSILDMVGQPIWESEWFCHDKKVVEQVKKDFRNVSKGKHIINQCTYMKTADMMGYMSYSGKPVYLEEGGELLFILAEARDITDLMLAQKELSVKLDELNIKNEELKKYIDSNMQLENFAYITSHDLREPLRTISGFANLLKRKYTGKLDSTADEYLHYILDSTKNMNALIKDLLIFSQVHTGEHKVEKLDLDALLKQIIKSLQVSIEEVNAKIKLNNIPKTINANSTKMKQLFQNLISNAIKFRKPDTAPQITISAKSKDKFWEFTVKDNGIGINEEYFDKIFMIFKRLHTKNEYEGTGIGLSLCKKIVEQHGGDIHLESTLGEGTTFYFTIEK